MISTTQRSSAVGFLMASATGDVYLDDWRRERGGHMTFDETVWHRVSYNLETPDDHWEPYAFTIGPSADNSGLIGRVSGDAEVDVPEPLLLPLMSRAQAAFALIDDLVMDVIGEWDWHQPELYEAYALRVARDPTAVFDPEQYAGETARLPTSPACFSPIEEGQIVTASFTLDGDDADELEAFLRERRGDGFVDGVLDGRYYPRIEN